MSATGFERRVKKNLLADVVLVIKRVLEFERGKMSVIT